MATYPAESPTETGLAATPRTPVNGDKVPGGCTLVINNANAAVCALSITTPKQLQGDLAVADRAVSVPNGTLRFVKIPNNDVYVGDDGLVTLATWSVTASVTYYVLRAS